MNPVQKLAHHKTVVEDWSKFLKQMPDVLILLLKSPKSMKLFHKKLYCAYHITDSFTHFDTTWYSYDSVLAF